MSEVGRDLPWMWTRGRSVAKETVNNINLIYAGEWAVIYPEGGGPGGGA